MPSDGGLSPSELIDRAYGRGLNAIAITDHDLTAGVADAVQRAALLNAKLLNGDADAPVETYIKENAEVNGVDNGELHRAPSERTLIVIPGVEFSTTWYDEQIHIVGLGIDPNNDSLKELEAKLKVARTQRAVAIGEKLKRLGFDRPYERCCEQAREGASITRGNYARLIFQDGKAKSVDDAFHKFLRRGQDAYVKSVWGPIEEDGRGHQICRWYCCISCIHDATRSPICVCVSSYTSLRKQAVRLSRYLHLNSVN